MIEQAKLAYSSLGKAFEKQAKMIEEQGKKQIKSIQDHRKQLAGSNELIKKDFNIDRDSTPLEERQKYLIDLLKKNLLKF